MYPLWQSSFVKVSGNQLYINIFGKKSFWRRSGTLEYEVKKSIEDLSEDDIEMLVKKLELEYKNKAEIQTIIMQLATLKDLKARLREVRSRFDENKKILDDISTTL